MILLPAWVCTTVPAAERLAQLRDARLQQEAAETVRIVWNAGIEVHNPPHREDPIADMDWATFKRWWAEKHGALGDEE